MMKKMSHNLIKQGKNILINHDPKVTFFAKHYQKNNEATSVQITSEAQRVEITEKLKKKYPVKIETDKLEETLKASEEARQRFSVY